MREMQHHRRQPKMLPAAAIIGAATAPGRIIGNDSNAAPSAPIKDAANPGLRSQSISIRGSACEQQLHRQRQHKCANNSGTSDALLAPGAVAPGTSRARGPQNVGTSRKDAAIRRHHRQGNRFGDHRQ